MKTELSQSLEAIAEFYNDGELTDVQLCQQAHSIAVDLDTEGYHELSEELLNAWDDVHPEDFEGIEELLAAVETISDKLAQ